MSGAIALGDNAPLTAVSAPSAGHYLLFYRAGVLTKMAPDGTETAVGGGSSPPFSDATALVKDDADATKLVRVDAGTVATGTTRVLTMPNADVDLGLQTPNTRTISTTTPLTGGGNLSANRTLAVDAASSTATGVVELATDAETTTGTDTTRATTPANVKAAIDARFAYYAIPFAFDGTLPASNTGRLKGIVWKTGTITKVFVKVRTAPTTQSILVDLNLNGTSIWNATQGNRVAIAAAGTSGTQTTFDTTAATENDYVTCDIDQAGSGTTGADLTVFLVIRYAL